MKRFLNHQEATVAFERGEVVKISSTIQVMSKRKIRMKNSLYIVNNMMPTLAHSHYEIVDVNEYKVITDT